MGSVQNIYAEEIVNKLKNNKYEDLENSIEKFELETYIRQYSNIKEKQLDYKLYLDITYSEILGLISDFYNGLEKHKKDNKTKSKRYIYNEYSLIDLILKGINTKKVPKTYEYCEIIRHLLKGVTYRKINYDVDDIVSILTESNLLKNYLKLKCLKKLKVYFIDMYSTDRNSSIFYNEQIIVNYYNEESCISMLQVTLQQIGIFIYRYIKKMGVNIDEKLNVLRHKTILLTELDNLKDYPLEYFFGDIFGIHITSEKKETFNKKNLGSPYIMVETGGEILLNEINNLFSEISSDNNIFN